MISKRDFDELFEGLVSLKPFGRRLI
jgi:hypothetical protein